MVLAADAHAALVELGSPLGDESLRCARLGEEFEDPGPGLDEARDGRDEEFEYLQRVVVGAIERRLSRGHEIL